MASMKRLLTVDEVAERFGLKPKTVRMMVWRRSLPYVKLNRSVRFKEDEITRIIEQSSVPALEAR